MSDPQINITPIYLSMAHMLSISTKNGFLCSITEASQSMLAAKIGRKAFFEEGISISPFNFFRRLSLIYP
jgi:hypothetical protein